MASCPKCGTKNDDDAVFCKNCGASLHSDVGATIEQQAKQFAKDMEQVGKKVGDRIAQTAKQIHEDTQVSARRFEHRMDRASRRAENWYDQTFGIIGPLLSSFIFLIVLRLAIAVLQLPSSETPDLNTFAGILLVYILPLFGVSLLSNYTRFFARKYYHFRMFSPLLYTITIVLLVWILARILSDVSVRFSITDLGSAAVSLENSLPTIFVFVLLLGYVILAINMPREREGKP
jgi:gas vesicle protein